LLFLLCLSNSKSRLAARLFAWGLSRVCRVQRPSCFLVASFSPRGWFVPRRVARTRRCAAPPAPVSSGSAETMVSGDVRSSGIAVAAVGSVGLQRDRRVSSLACRPLFCGEDLPVANHILSVGPIRPVRPRFGVSDRRPSSLRSASISRPQRPFSAFFPWPLRAHSSRDKKASPWPPSTACRPCGCGPIASGQRQPSRPRWSRPENRKRIRTWLPSATSPSTATA
jgi:hypothetical protein